MSIFNSSDYNNETSVDLDVLDERYMNQESDTIEHLNIKSIQMYDTASISFKDNSIQSTAFNSDVTDNIYLEVQNIIDNNSITTSENTFTQKNIFDNDVNINNQLKINDTNNNESFFTTINQVGKVLNIDSAGVNGAISFKSNGSTKMRINPGNINFYDTELRNVKSIKYEDNSEQFTAFTEEHLAKINSNGNEDVNDEINTLQNKTANLTRVYLPESNLGPEFDQLIINAPDNIILKNGLEDGVEIITDRVKFGNRIITQCPTITDIKDDITDIQTDITNNIKTDITNVKTDITNVKNITGKFIINGDSLVVSSKDLDLNNNDIKNVNTYEIGTAPSLGYISTDANDNVEIKGSLDQDIILTTNASNSSGYSPGPHKLTISTPEVDLGYRTILNCPTIDNIYTSINLKPSYAKCRITVNSSNQYIYDWHSNNLRRFVNSSVYVSKQSTGLITLMLDTEENGGPPDDHFVVYGNGRQYANADLGPRRGIHFTVIYKSSVYSSGVFKGHTVQLQLTRTEGIDEVYDLIYYNSTHQGWLDVFIAW